MARRVGSWAARWIAASLLCSGIMLYPSAAHATISLVRKASGTIGGATSMSATFAATPTQGDFLVCIGTTATGGPKMMTPVGWNLALENYPGASNSTIAVWWRIAGASEPTTVTLNFEGGAQPTAGGSIWIAEYSSVDTNPLDKSSSTTAAASTSQTSPSVTTTSANEVLLVAFVADGATSYSAWTNSFTEEYDQWVNGTSTSHTLTVADRIVSATGTYSTTATAANSFSYTKMIITFKEVTPAASAGAWSF